MGVLLNFSVVGVPRGSVVGQLHNRGYPHLTFFRPTQRVERKTRSHIIA